MDENVARAARSRGGVIVLRGAPSSLAALVDRRGELRRTGRRSAVSATSPPSDDQRLWVARAEVGEPMAFTGATAAVLLGFREARHAPTLTVMVPTTRRIAAVPGVSIVRAASDDLAGSRQAGGHPVTSVEVTLRELARVVSPPQLLTAVQDQLRLRTTTESRLRSVTGRGRAGSARLRAALDVAGDGAHSRAERALSAALRTAGVTGFRRQVPIAAPGGGRYWLDLLFDEVGIGVEVMGPHHLEPEQFDYDCRRANHILGAHRIRLLRFSATRVLRDRDAVVGDILAAVVRLVDPARRIATVAP